VVLVGERGQVLSIQLLIK